MGNLRGHCKHRLPSSANLLEQSQSAFEEDENDYFVDEVCKEDAIDWEKLPAGPRFQQALKKRKRPSLPKVGIEPGHAYHERRAALKSGEWPSAPEENLRMAASLIRRLAKSQRPSSLNSLAAWLSRRACCRVRSDI